MLFCDLVGFTALSDQADPEDVRARIRPYHTRLRTEIEQFGGTVEKFIGDAVMAVFGAPVAHEDDAERAVRSGLRILEAIEELNLTDPGLGLQVRVGINTGEAVVALGARPEQGEGIVTGDVIKTRIPVGTLTCHTPRRAATVSSLDFGGQQASSPERRFRMEAMAVPITPGKLGAWEAWVAELKGPRKAGFDDMNARYELTTHATWLQANPDGNHTVVVVLDGPGSAEFMGKLAASDHEFDAWFRSVIEDVHPTDFSSPPPPAPQRGL